MAKILNRQLVINTDGGVPALVVNGSTVVDHDGTIVSPVTPGDVDFVELGDVPASYAGQASKVVAVKGDETGLEFVTANPGDITAVTARNGVTGGGTSGAVSVGLGVTIYNNLGTTLTAGTLVHISSYTGVNGVTVVRADDTLGLDATHYVGVDIADGASGVVLESGDLVGIDTHLLAIGTPIYQRDAGTYASSFTTSATAIIQQVGQVKVSNVAGTIYFAPGNYRPFVFGGNNFQNGSVNEDTISPTADIALTQLAPLTAGQIIVGSAGNVATAVVMSGDATISNTGVVTVTASGPAVTTRTATVDGATTGQMASGSQVCAVTSANATFIITLPAPVVGTEITLSVGANGYLIHSTDPNTVAMNGYTGAMLRAIIAANEIVHIICTSTTNWSLFSVTSMGPVQTNVSIAP